MDTLAYNTNILFSAKLILDYAYYELGVSLVPDERYDGLSLTLYDRWGECTHPHKKLVSREDLTVSGFAIKFPSIVKYSAIEEVNEFRINKDYKFYL